ncbi:MAG TPA: YcjX family protein [Alphaproteobacteria bacterium]|nr:YcjX family protein [Alphaproteobacteria bacterium]
MADRGGIRGWDWERLRRTAALQNLDLEAFSPKVELGVTGLSRAGKTIFIASLVHNLLHAEEAARKGNLTRLEAVRDGRYLGAVVRHDVRPEVPEFPHRALIRAMTGAAPAWPERTSDVSRISLEIRFKRADTLVNRLRPAVGTLQLGITDYPGEWLLDLPMRSQGYEDWSRRTVERMRRPERAALAAEWLALAEATDPAAPAAEETAIRLHEVYTAYLKACAAPPANLRFNQPGRFLMPGEFRGTPLLRFAPLPLAEGARPAPGSLHALFAERYRQYLAQIVERFYDEHFRRLNRQVVLIDLLKAINDGEAAFDDMAEALAVIVRHFDHGENGLLSWLTGRRIDRVLFAATKADHVSRNDRIHLERLTERVVNRVDEGFAVRWSGARHAVLPIAALRCTTDRMRADTGRHVLIGRRPGDPEPLALEPGAVPPEYPPPWGEFAYRFWDFQLPPLAGAHAGFPNIGMSEALEYLIGDRLT